jgi:hypothetical protein
MTTGLHFCSAVRTIADAHVSVKDTRYWYAYALLRQLGAVWTVLDCFSDWAIGHF